MKHQLFNCNFKASSSNNQNLENLHERHQQTPNIHRLLLLLHPPLPPPPLRSVPAQKHSEQHPPAGTPNKEEVVEMQLPRRNTTVTKQPPTRKPGWQTGRPTTTMTTKAEGRNCRKEGTEEEPVASTYTYTQCLHQQMKSQSSSCASLGLTHTHARMYVNVCVFLLLLRLCHPTPMQCLSLTCVAAITAASD